MEIEDTSLEIESFNGDRALPWSLRFGLEDCENSEAES